MKPQNNWIGVDLDGTLSHYDEWVNWNVFGEVIEPMRERILKWLAEGIEVRIFTARVGFDADICYKTGEQFTRAQMVKAIQDWLEANGMPRLAVTHEKDNRMIELWDDRAVQVIKNTGRTLSEEHAAELLALQGAP